VIACGPAPDEAVRAAAALRRRFAPSLVIASGDGVPMADGKQPEGQGFLHLCRDTACLAPTADIEAVVAALDDVNAYDLE
jgi:hypothetical protein